MTSQSEQKKDQGTPSQEELIDEQVLGLARALAVKFHKKLSPKRRILREDLESVALEALVHASNDYKSDCGMKFTSYAYMKIRGALVDELRERFAIKRGRGAVHEQFVYGETARKLHELKSQCAEGLDIDFLIELRRLLPHLREAISALPKEQQEIIELRYSQDMSYAQIRDQIGIKHKNQARRVHLEAVQALKTALRESTGKVF